VIGRFEVNYQVTESGDPNKAAARLATARPLTKKEER
jgi:hypothetical protein